MDDKTMGAVDASDYYANERILAAHAPYSDEQNHLPAYHGSIQMAQPGMQMVMVDAEKPWVWNWCTLITAVIGFFLCPLCGFVGTVLGLLSYTDHQNKQFNAARSKKNCALCCGITALVISAIVVIIIIAVVATTVGYVEKAVQQASENGN